MPPDAPNDKHGRPREQRRDQNGKLHGFRRKNTAPDSILEAHPQGLQLFRERVPAFSGLGRGVDGRLNGLGALL